MVPHICGTDIWVVAQAVAPEAGCQATIGSGGCSPGHDDVWLALLAALGWVSRKEHRHPGVCLRSELARAERLVPEEQALVQGMVELEPDTERAR